MRHIVPDQGGIFRGDLAHLTKQLATWPPITYICPFLCVKIFQKVSMSLYIFSAPEGTGGQKVPKIGTIIFNHLIPEISGIKQLDLPIFKFDPDGQGVALENFSMSILGPFRDALLLF